MRCQAISKSTGEPCGNDRHQSVAVTIMQRAVKFIMVMIRGVASDMHVAEVCNTHADQLKRDGEVKLHAVPREVPNAHAAYLADKRANEKAMRKAGLKQARESSAVFDIIDNKPAGVYKIKKGAKKMFVISFTGHRPNKLPQFGNKGRPAYDEVENHPLRNAIKREMLARVKRAIEKHGDEYEIVIVTGGALGVDQWAARLAVHLNLRYVVVKPGVWQESKWTPASIEFFNEKVCGPADADLATTLAKRVKKVMHNNILIEGGVMTLNYEDGYASSALQLRNEVMVDLSDAVIAVWNGGNGGTKNCVAYAQSEGVPISHINPTTLEVK